MLRTVLLRSLRGVLLVLLAAACRAPASQELVTSPAQAAPEPFEVQVWRAGRFLPPGMPAARRAQLEGVRVAALESLGQCTSPESALGALLRRATTPDELWAAAARSAAALELYGLVEPLVAALAPGTPAVRSVAARGALHRLYGRWFTSPEEVQPFRRAVKAGDGTRLLLESHAWEEARSRERLLAGLAHDPAGAVAWLGDPDPRVRSGAARLLSQVFTSGVADAGTTLEALIAHLEIELEPEAFQGGLEACVLPLERAEPGNELLARLRGLLLTLARAPLDPRQPSAAAALARLPWRTSGPLDGAHVLTGLDTLGYTLGLLGEADRRRGVNDPDSLVVVLGAVRALCDRATGAGLGAELQGSSAREAVLAVLSEPSQAPGARSTAAAMLGPFCSGADGPRLAALLLDPSADTTVQHALLGAMRSFLAPLDPADGGARALTLALARLTGAADLDLRRRALGLCADPALAAHVQRLDPAFLVARLAQEQSPESASDLLRLVQRIGNPDLLGPVLSMPGFERQAADPERLPLLAATIESLVQDSPRRALAAAARLAGGGVEAGNLMRLRQALRLVARLDAAGAHGLSAAQHRAVCDWVWRLSRAGTPPSDAVPEGRAFERRLLEVHLPQAELQPTREAGDFGPFEGAHLTALLRADLFLAGDGAGSKGLVEAAFENASQLAPEGALQRVVLRDRARFRAAASEGVKAMADYRRLLATDPEILGLPDLRTAVALVERLGEPAGQGRPASLREASDLLRRIVERPAWRAEPASVRMQDLRDLVAASVGGRERERLAWIEGALADLPLTQNEAQVLVGSDPALPPLWFGLTREAAWLQELLDLRARVRLGLRELDA